MKIQCDVCSSSEASVFCSADEAALCSSCDHRVHHANKLASKHQRFSLVMNPDKKDVPVCDICQEKRAFLFCQQDRAVLCKDCDFSIHSANEHTQKHNRFLLTGVRLSAHVLSSSAAKTTASETSLTGSCGLVPEFKSQPLNKRSNSVSNPTLNPQSLAVERIASPSSSSGGGKSVALKNDVGISEYLIEMLPGWHVEDFLDSTSDPDGFSKGDEGMFAFNNGSFQTSNLSSFPSQNAAVWVPQAPQPPSKQASHYAASHLSGNISFKEATSTKSNMQWADEGFAVPQISPQSTNTSSKRSRPLWYL
uniref:B box-type domain-containing protein n=1 Tax=Kalanchoe fedtschenkoi TaxID=63787 RepID=A0A7N1A4V0_KALFE